MALGLVDAWRDIRRLRTQPPGRTAYMRLRTDIGEKGHQAMQGWTRVTDVSPYALCAIIGAEDPAFFHHHGIWWGQLAIQMYVAAFRGGRIRAVSTITQQLARNLYLHEGRSVTRKLLEMVLARRLEMVLEKPRILELYVNVVEWGPGVWGIAPAARTYFDSTAEALNPFQAVVLASLLPAPRSPLAGNNLARALASQRSLLHFLYGAGVMSLPEWRETADRLSQLGEALRAGKTTAHVLRDLGKRPYARPASGGGSPTPVELLESECGHQLRVAYTALLYGALPRQVWTRKLPYRWTGTLAE